MKIRLIVSLLVLCSIASARTYYVATPQNGGNDNYDGLASAYISGSRGPWASWEKAFTSASVQPGDTVFIRGGIYFTTVVNGTGIKVTRNGTSDNWIVYINYPGEKPIMDCSNITAGDIQYTGLRNYGIVVDEIDYVKIKGLTIRNVNQYYTRNFGIGIELRSGYVILENFVAHNIEGTGIRSAHNSGGSSVYGTHYIINCDAYNVCDSFPPIGNVGNGFAVNNDYSTNGETYLTYCRAWHCADQGFNLATDSYVEAVGCWSFCNTETESVGGTGGGSGFKMGWQNVDSPIIRRKVYNCIAAYNDGCGFFTNENGSGDPPDWNAVKSNHFNNIAYHNGFGTNNFNYLIQDTKQVDAIQRWRNFSNNIDYVSARGYTYLAGGTAKYSGSNNTWDIPLTLTDADFVSLDTTGITAPRKADGSLPDNNCYKNFLRLSAGSRAINRGIDVGLEYSGSAPDLGPFEYISGSIIPPAPPVYVSSVIENSSPSRLDMTYNMSLANIVPAASAFTVRVNSSARSVSSVVISGTKVQLTLSSPVVYGDVVTAAYTKPATNPLQTAAGGQAATITAQNVTNNVTPTNPVYVSSVIESATPARLDMTYNLTLANIVPAASAFTVRVNSSVRTVSSVVISGTGVQLTLSSPVVYDDVVTIAYTKPATNPLQTPAGGQAASISPSTVTNNCKLSANQPPVSNISSPGKSSSFTAPATIELNVNAYDIDGTISRVELFNNNVKLAEFTTAPYSFIWKDVPAGTYTITAIATDNQNSKSVSDPITVNVSNITTTVNQLPVVSITSPLNKSTFEVPQTISLTAEADDPDGTINKVEYYIGDNKIGESTSVPFMFPLEIENAGIYELTAIAYDNLNGSSSSSTVIFYTTLYINDPDIINLYPNPNNGMFTISLVTVPLSEKNVVTISDLTGKILYKSILNKNENPSQFDLTDLDSGIYILMIYSDKIAYTKKFIKT